jgi:cobalamin biosynthesis protein CobW
MDRPAPRIPTLVVSGFLGSGKTTLVQRLLDQAQRRGERLAIVSNEFGALGIDRALLESGEGRYVELAGGCVCCTLSDELVQVLEAVRREVTPDRIVIETSGVALPYETQLSLWRPPVSAWVGDDMAVVLVNAEQLAEGRDLGPTFEQQISSADLLLLNQLDRVERDAWPRLEARLRALEPEVPIVRCVHADVDPALLEPPELDARADRRRAGGPHVHEPFEVETWSAPSGLAPEELIELLRAAGAVRAKGFVETSEGLRLVQGVGRRIELLEASAPPPALRGRVVLIRRASD